MAAIGVHFPQAEIGADFMVIRDFVQAAEELGFDHINVPDHVIQTRTPRADHPIAWHYTTEYPHHETMTLLAFIAGVTRRVILKSAVLVLPQRQTALVAKQAAEIDVLSGGRMQLGVGQGWNEPEYEALGVEFARRHERMEEQITVCRRLWTEQHVTFHGEWHHIEDAGLAPMPVQRPIPIWVGAFARPAVRRAARIADGWQAMLPAPNDKAARTFEAFRTAVTEAGRDPDAVGIEATLWATGDEPQKWVDEARAWLAVGATQIVFRPQGTFAEIERAVSAFAPLLDELR